MTERGGPSLPCSPASTPTSPSALGIRLSDPLLSTCSSGPLGGSAGGEYQGPVGGSMLLSESYREGRLTELSRCVAVAFFSF